MATTTHTENHLFRLKSRPVGLVTPDNFDYVQSTIPKLGPNEVLIRTVYLSLDPTNRIWMSDIEQYMPPVKIGETMRGLGIGQVEQSNNSRFKVGDYVSGMLGWQEYVIATGNEPFPLVTLPKIAGVPLAALAGAAGMTGWTAYFGLLDVGAPKKGETLVVSAAAGAVGSIVGQIGKLNGLRVVGIAGGEHKCNWLIDELGFDAAVDYKQPSWQKQLQQATPNGIDIDFENVGGEIMEEVYKRMNLNGRIVLCGLIASYNEADDSKTKLGLAPALMKRLRIQGFIITDYALKIQDATDKLVHWIAEGKIKHRETVIAGLENAPIALNKLFDGGNTGKLLIKVSDP
jgi:NADPH-dependent curcumin reductase CurA